MNLLYLKLLRSSAGCCSKIIRFIVEIGGLGSAEHQQTTSGRLELFF